VGAAYGCAFAIDKGLNAKADAVDAQALDFIEDRVSDLARRRFERDFGVGGHVEVSMECSEDAAKLHRFEEAGGSAAAIAARLSANLPRTVDSLYFGGGIDLGAEVRNVAVDSCGRGDA
jgi:hypothetical protein